MLFPDRGCIRPLRHLYGYATGCRTWDLVGSPQFNPWLFLRCHNVRLLPFAFQLNSRMTLTSLQSDQNFRGPQQAACRTVVAAVNRYLLPAPDLSSKPAGRRCCYRPTGETKDERTDEHSTVLRHLLRLVGCLSSRVFDVLDSGAVGPGFKSQPRLCRVTVFGKLFTPIVPVFTKQRNW